jgi:hypothetical protein
VEVEVLQPIIAIKVLVDMVVVQEVQQVQMVQQMVQQVLYLQETQGKFHRRK